jgi:hypothetical protein
MITMADRITIIIVITIAKIIVTKIQKILSSIIAGYLDMTEKASSAEILLLKMKIL